MVIIIYESYIQDPEICTSQILFFIFYFTKILNYMQIKISLKLIIRDIFWTFLRVSLSFQYVSSIYNFLPSLNKL